MLLAFTFTEKGQKFVHKKIVTKAEKGKVSR